MNKTDIELVRQPIPNMDKIYAVLDQIEADPEHWDQGTWSRLGECGTVMCFAGWACKMEGLTLAVELREEGFLSDASSAALASGGNIMTTATDILGLTEDECMDLFLSSYVGIPEVDLRRVKVEVAKISARAKEQRAAFERVAKELIASVPELEAVIEPGYLCPESRDTVLAHIGGQDGGN